MVWDLPFAVKTVEDGVIHQVCLHCVLLHISCREILRWSYDSRSCISLNLWVHGWIKYQ